MERYFWWREENWQEPGDKSSEQGPEPTTNSVKCPGLVVTFV